MIALRTADGTVPAVPRVAEPPAEMVSELSRLVANHARTHSDQSRDARNAAIVRWHQQLGAGSLSLIARTAKVSRVQAGRIVKAASETTPGQPPPPTRRYYQ